MNDCNSEHNIQHESSLYNSLYRLISLKNILNKNNLEIKDNNYETTEKEETDLVIAKILQRWLNTYEIQNEITSSVEEKLKILSEIMDKKASDLSHKFQILYQNSQNQRSYMQELMQLASGILIEEKSIPIEEIAVRVLGTFSKSTNTLQELAERARLMIDRVSEATHTLTDIETSIKSIGLINKKTKYLSLNAMIEAVKDQQGKEGAMAVANEVRELSNDTQLITTIIAEQSQKMRTILEDAQQTLQAVASFDFSQSINAEHIIGKMIDGLVDNNKKVNKIMDITTESTREFSETAGALIKSMQYEDRTQQDIQNLIREINSIKQIFESLPLETKHIMNEYYKNFTQEIEEAVISSPAVPYHASKLLTGEEESSDVILF